MKGGHFEDLVVDGRIILKWILNKSVGKLLAEHKSGQDNVFHFHQCVQTVAYRGGCLGGSTPPEIPKAHQNRAKLNPIVKTVKNC